MIKSIFFFAGKEKNYINLKIHLHFPVFHTEAIRKACFLVKNSLENFIFNKKIIQPSWFNEKPKIYPT